MKITRVSLKSNTRVTIPFATHEKDWTSFPFPANHAVDSDDAGRHADALNQHTAGNPERITPKLNGECLVMAKYNFRDIVTAGATSVATRFARATAAHPDDLDITWTNELAVAAMTDGVWCHTANGPQKSMVRGQFWVAQLKVTGAAGGSVVVELAEFILTGWHD